MTLRAGFYAMEIAAWRRLEDPWKHEGRRFETVSPLGFLRALTHREPIPAYVRIPGLDRALYQVYRQHETLGADEASRQVERAVRWMGKVLYNSRDVLLRQGPVVLFVLEYLEQGIYWKAGIRHRWDHQPRELFRLEWLFPRCEVTQVDGEIVCSSSF